MSLLYIPHHMQVLNIGTGGLHPFLFPMGSISLGETRMFLMVLLPLNWVCIPYLLHILDAFA